MNEQCKYELGEYVAMLRYLIRNGKFGNFQIESAVCTDVVPGDDPMSKVKFIYVFQVLSADERVVITNEGLDFPESVWQDDHPPWVPFVGYMRKHLSTLNSAKYKLSKLTTDSDMYRTALNDVVNTRTLCILLAAQYHHRFGVQLGVVRHPIAKTPTYCLVNINHPVFRTAGPSPMMKFIAEIDGDPLIFSNGDWLKDQIAESRR